MVRIWWHITFFLRLYASCEMDIVGRSHMYTLNKKNVLYKHSFASTQKPIHSSTEWAAAGSKMANAKQNIGALPNCPVPVRSRPYNPKYKAWAAQHQYYHHHHHHHRRRLRQPQSAQVAMTTSKRSEGKRALIITVTCGAGRPSSSNKPRSSKRIPNDVGCVCVCVCRTPGRVT